MRQRLFWVVLCLILSFSVAASAQTSNESELYRIQPGDVITIVVYGQPDLTLDVLVLPDGTVSYPFIGAFQVRDLTADQVAEHISSVLSTVVRSPIVSVQVNPGRGPSIVVLGEVRSPGVYPVAVDGVDLLEAIARAGGTTASADLARVKVYDRGNIQDYKEAPIGVEGVLFEGEAAQNPVVAVGNIIYVPPVEADHEVFVLGEVRSPGAYTLTPGREARLLDIIARAGGTTASADLARVKVYDRGNIQDYKEAPIGAEGVLFEGEAAQNPVVAVGNIIYVPPVEADHEIFVLGEVRSPGAYTLTPGREARLLDIIARAGGTTASADLARVKVYDRGNIQDYKEAPIGAEGVLFEGEAAQNPVVAVGNIIYVPPVEADHEIFVLGEVRSPGAYTLTPGREARLLDIIARAGGTTASADLARVKVYDRGNIQDYKEAPIGAEGVLFEGEAAENPVVAVGNIIYVPPVEADHEIFVLGEVRSPGAYTLTPGREARLLDIIARAGGTTASADLARVKVYDRGNIQDYKEAPIGAEGVLFEGEAAENPVVAVGNIIYVPPVEADHEIFVLGEVRSPGAYTLTPGREARLLDIIARAGGTTASADLARVKVYDRGNIQDYKEAPIGAEGVLFEGEAAENPVVAVGNIIYVPPVEADHEVFVLGEVRSPGAYTLTPGREARLLDIIARAGGTTASADLARVKVYDRGNIQDYKEAPIGAEGVLFEGEAAENPIIASGNIIYVPKGIVEVNVMGLVARPGPYEVRPGERVLGLLAQAGGVLPEADSSGIVLRRELPFGEVVTSIVSLDRMLISGAGDDNPVLQDGDVIYVRPTIQVAVAGEVRSNGVFRLKSTSRVTDAILAAGGVSDNADLNHMTITRSTENGHEVIPVDFEAILMGRGENPLLMDGDIVNVSRTSRLIYVVGEVARPGAYAYVPEARLIDLVYQAGGPTSLADLQHVTVFAEHEREVFAGSLYQNPFVQPGQTVFVPRRMMEVFVVGEAAKTGRIEVPRDSRILDVVAAIGGPQATGNWHSVQVFRNVGDESVVHVVDITALLENPSTYDNLRLVEGDVVYVPSEVAEVSIIGEVARPGVYTLSRNARLVDALAAAGGVGVDAALEQVSILQSGERIDVSLGKWDELDIEKLQESVELRDGGVVVVPKSNRIRWQDIVTILTGVKVILDFVNGL